jgi:hypothetical protein
MAGRFEFRQQQMPRSMNEFVASTSFEFTNCIEGPKAIPTEFRNRHRPKRTFGSRFDTGLIDENERAALDRTSSWAPYVVRLKLSDSCGARP